jgi:hypothetical protein
MEPDRKENNMPATVEFTGDIARLILSGDFDFSTQEDLSNAIEKVLNANAMREIYVDLTECNLYRFFCDPRLVKASGKARSQMANP